MLSIQRKPPNGTQASERITCQEQYWVLHACILSVLMVPLRKRNGRSAWFQQFCWETRRTQGKRKVSAFPRESLKFPSKSRAVCKKMRNYTPKGGPSNISNDYSPVPSRRPDMPPLIHTPKNTPKIAKEKIVQQKKKVTCSVGLSVSKWQVLYDWMFFTFLEIQQTVSVTDVWLPWLSKNERSWFTWLFNRGFVVVGCGWCVWSCWCCCHVFRVNIDNTIVVMFEPTMLFWKKKRSKNANTQKKSCIHHRQMTTYLIACFCYCFFYGMKNLLFPNLAYEPSTLQHPVHVWLYVG